MTLWRPGRTDPAPFSLGAGSSRLWGRAAGRYRREITDARTLSARRMWVGRWREVAEGCGLARIVHVAAGVTVSAPHVGGVRVDEDGRVTSATVEMHPGQTLAEYRAAASRIAAAFGCARVRFDPVQGQWVRLVLLEVDPLARSVLWRPTLPAGFVAVAETGGALVVPWERRPHAIAQGQTGSGKSWWLYGQVAALAGRRDVQVAGVDPSGVLFRPWAGQPGEQWRASGLADSLEEPRRVLRALVAELDRRLTLLPAGRDVLDTDERTPLLAIVLEEYPGLIRAAQTTGTGKAVENEVRGHVARLLAEGRKVGLRVLLVAQRADAAIVDGLVRSQCALRVSFASEADGLNMLHPRGSVELDEHADAAPGVAAVTAPRVGTIRVRAAALEYARYCDLVTAAGHGARAA